MTVSVYIVLLFRVCCENCVVSTSQVSGKNIFTESWLMALTATMDHYSLPDELTKRLSIDRLTRWLFTVRNTNYSTHLPRINAVFTYGPSRRTRSTYKLRFPPKDNSLMISLSFDATTMKLISRNAYVRIPNVHSGRML